VLHFCRSMVYNDANRQTTTLGSAHCMIPSDDFDSGFSLLRLERLAQLERWHFWFTGRRLLVDSLLTARVAPAQTPGLLLDLGCGTGFELRRLGHLGYEVVGLDLRPEGLVATRASDRQIPLLQARAPVLPLADGSLGGVLLLDVAEHLESVPLLAELRRALRPGGFGILTVPALPWLWSYRDEAAGHLRRYTRDQLLAALEQAGFRVERVAYFQFLLLPLVMVTRLLGRRGPALRDLEERPLPVLNSALAVISRLDAAVASRVSWPWGSSLVAVFRKP
jgi:SAM-dependent methyltransferase